MIVTCAVAVAEPSETVYATSTGPWKLAGGEYRICPARVTSAVPADGPSTAVMPSLFSGRSSSVSFARTAIVIGVSSSVVPESSLATGAMLTSATSMVTVIVSSRVITSSSVAVISNV